MSTAYTKKSERQHKEPLPAEADLIVIGGGAAGLFAAGAAALHLPRVVLLEKNAVCGQKLRLTGKGRCNVTNNCAPDEIIRHTLRNPRFLYASLAGFPPERTMEFFSSLGVPLQTERGRRVFPASGHAADVVNALRDWGKARGVILRRGTAEKILSEKGAVTGVRTAAGESLSAPRVLLATGGMSYPSTGSDGSGYHLAVDLGHTIIPPEPSLVPLTVAKRQSLARLRGLKLRNVEAEIITSGGKKFRQFGEFHFLTDAVTGPIVLTLSAYLSEKDFPARLCLNLKPALSPEQLDARLLRDFAARKRENLAEGLRGLLLPELVEEVLSRAGIPPSRRVADVSRAERLRIRDTISCLDFPVTGKASMAQAVITRGGVAVKEVNPRTMESRLVKGLYFAGEILDVDALTGGYNLQAAWATAHAAAAACCGKSPGDPL